MRPMASSRTLASSSRKLGRRRKVWKTPDFVVKWRATRMLSMTVRLLKIRRFWKVRAMPLWTMRKGFSPLISSPLKRIFPAVGV